MSGQLESTVALPALTVQEVNEVHYSFRVSTQGVALSGGTLFARFRG